MTAIYKRELRSYFHGVMGYVFTAFVLIIIGMYTMVFNLMGNLPTYEFVFYNIAFIYLIIIPLLTMRSISEERRQKTDQLLYSSPVSLTQIVLGKYFALLTVLAVPLGISALYPLVLMQFGTLSMGVIYSAIGCFFLMGAAMIAIGLFVSALTENPFIAAVITFGILIATFFAGDLSSMLTGSAIKTFYAFTVLLLLFMLLVRYMTKNWTIALGLAIAGEVVLLLFYLLLPARLGGAFTGVLRSVGLFGGLYQFMYGIMDLTVYVYYLSIACLFVFFSIQALEKRRWS